MVMCTRVLKIPLYLLLVNFILITGLGESAVYTLYLLQGRGKV